MENTSQTNLIAVTILKHFSYFMAIFVSLNSESYGVLGVLMLVDTVTGVIRSGVVHGWRSITSHAASSGILAKGLMILVPFLIAITGHGLGFDLKFIAKATLNVMILSELYSILSNIQSIRIRQDVQEFDAVTYILSFLRNILAGKIKKQF